MHRSILKMLLITVFSFLLTGCPGGDEEPPSPDIPEEEKKDCTLTEDQKACEGTWDNKNCVCIPLGGKPPSDIGG